MTESSDKLKNVYSKLLDLQLYKNVKYGDSALHPIKTFSKLNVEDSICIRLDDKLSRINNNESDEIRKNDVADIIGYLVLLCISKGWSDFSEFKD